MLTYSLSMWRDLGMTEYNRYIAAKFYRKIVMYHIYNKEPFKAHMAGGATEELHCMRAEYVFAACKIFMTFLMENHIKKDDMEIINFQRNKMENYLKFFQEDLLHLENFTYQELSYNIKLYSIVRQYYYAVEKKKEIPYFPNFFDIAKEYFYATIDKLPFLEQAMLESAVHWNGNMSILGLDWK